MNKCIVSPKIFDPNGVIGGTVIAFCSAMGFVLASWSLPQERDKMGATLFEEKIGGVSGFGSHPRIAKADAFRNLREKMTPSTFSINGQTVVIWCEIESWKWGFLAESGKVTAIHECESEDSARRVAVMELCRRAVDASAVVTPGQVPECVQDPSDREQFYQYCLKIRQHTLEGRSGFAELVRPSGHF